MAQKRNYGEWSKEELIREILALKKQKTYGLVWEREKTKEDFDLFINWEGEKTKEEFSPESKDKFPVLAEIKDKEINSDKDKPVNLLIEGDNYHSLAVLNFTHKNSVDIIYIDPPYNTGNKDFKYNDKFVDKEDGYRHSKWLSFMSKRLALAKNLLKDKGFIFISIDDHEGAQLKILCDDLFGEINYVGTVVWKKTSGDNSSEFCFTHDNILVYKKSSLAILGKAPLSEKSKEQYKNPDNDIRGHWAQTDYKSKWTKEQRPNLYYGIKNPHTGKIVYPDSNGKTNRVWAYSKEAHEINVKENKIWWGKEGKADIPKLKRFLSEMDGINLRSVWDDAGTNDDASKELKELFDGKKIFDNPKPTSLIKKIMSFFPNKNGIVLDFFAGSGTTGHAVLSLNKEDNGNRTFILCTNNEDNNGDGLKICTDICYPRIKKISAKLSGNLKYYKTDFVEAEQTDKNKRKLVDNCTEMLCIKENTFEKVKDAKKFKIFKNDKLHLGIIFDDEYIDEFVKEAEKISGKIHVYVFSHDDSVPTKEFKTIKNKVTLCPIPETILKVYRKVFKND
jgi:adenine-specific DNA-methyltransferase